MQKHFSLLIYLLCFYSSASAINVSGLISTNTTWTKTNSPYIITGDIDVDTGVTLTVEAGVHVLFAGNYTLYVDGIMNAVGTASDSIVFASNKSNPGRADWKSILVRHTNPNDTFNFSYCNFHNGAIALYMRFTPARVTNCIFDNNTTGIEDFTDLHSYIFVSNSYFSNNDNAGAWLSSNSFVTDCEFRHNTSGVHGSGMVTNSLFYYNWNGIEGCSKVQNNIVAYSANFGLYECANISYNQVWYNKIGIRFGSNITHNGVRFNETGIECATNAQTTTKFITNNCIDSNTKYNLSILSQYNADISDNYWGSTDKDTISKYIRDFKNDFTLGKVSYQPFLSSPDSGCAASIPSPIDTTTPPPSTTVEKMSAATQVQAYPNPATSSIIFNSNSEKRLQDIMVYNMTGILVAHTICNDKKVTLDVSAMPPGIYSYKVLLNDNTTTAGRLIKE